MQAIYCHISLFPSNELVKIEVCICINTKIESNSSCPGNFHVLWVWPKKIISNNYDLQWLVLLFETLFPIPGPVKWVKDLALLGLWCR